MWNAGSLLAEVVSPSLVAMFEPEELQVLSVSLKHDRFGSWEVEVSLGDDWFGYELVKGDSGVDKDADVDELSRDLRSKLQDYIACSRFAWGQLRPV